MLRSRLLPRHRPGTLPAVVLAALTSVCVAGVAQADPSPTDKALAEQLFRDGKDLMGSGKIAEACAKFADSERYDPQLGTLLNLALCHEQAGRTASAWVEFGDAASLAGRVNEPERAAFARKHALALEAKLTRLRVRVTTSAPGLTVRVDGVVLAASAVGEPVPVDPGSHTIEASAPGKAAFTSTVTIVGGAKATDVVVALDDAGAAAVPADTAAHGSFGKTLAIVAFGVGVAGLAVGSYFGVATFAKKSDESTYCDASNCSPQGINDQNAARTDATLSTIGFGVGLAAAGVGVALLALSGSPKPAAPSAVWVAPQLEARGAGFGVGGRW